MRKFTLKIGLLLVLVVFIDSALGRFMEFSYFKQKKGKGYRITNVLENVKSDILIFGSSRAAAHYDPSIIEKATGLSTYNLGLGGQSIMYHKAILDVILKRYKPKLILLELYEGMDFESGMTPYDRLSVLLPYCNKYPSIKKVVEQRSYFESLKLLSKLYPYNSLLLRIIEGNLGYLKTDDTDNGFIPAIGYWNFPIKEKTQTQTNYNEDHVRLFYDFVNVCKQNDISLFVVISPIYQKSKDHFSFSQQICDSAKVHLHNYSSESVYISNNKFFQNIDHLNAEGAKVYSEFISLKLNDWLKTEIIN